jgi:hypothetical protein
MFGDNLDIPMAVRLSSLCSYYVSHMHEYFQTARLGWFIEWQPHDFRASNKEFGSEVGKVGQKLGHNLG